MAKYIYEGLKENGVWEKFESDVLILVPEQIEETGYSEVRLVNDSN